MDGGRALGMGQDRMQAGTLIGPEVHWATVCLSVAQGTRGGEVRHWGMVPQHLDHVGRLAGKLAVGGAR
jgi:hypothetical protein